MGRTDGETVRATMEAESKRKIILTFGGFAFNETFAATTSPKVIPGIPGPIRLSTIIIMTIIIIIIIAIAHILASDAEQ